MLSDPWHLLTAAPAGQAFLYQPFKDKVNQLLVNCAARGHVFFVSSGFRSVKEQEDLFAQGRTKPGKIVTNAKGGQSAHQYRIACDFTHDADDNAANGLQPDWAEGAYKVLADEAQKLSLEPGFTWRFQDRPHVQLPLDSKGIALFKDGTGRPDLFTLLEQGGHDTVFAFLDKYGW